MLVGLSLVGLAAPALAHHSMAMFDKGQAIQLTGTVKKMLWTNPHSWLHIMVRQPDGSEVEWSLESQPPVDLLREGWKRNSVKAGDKVTVVASPLKDGRPGGSLINVTLPDGMVLGRPVDPRQITQKIPAHASK
jgi:hypothetical protein